MKETDEVIRNYEVNRVLYRSADKAARAALAVVTRDNAAVVPSEDEDGTRKVILATAHMIKTWRARLQVLRRLGWERVAGKHWFYCTNCPPVGVSTIHRRAFCCKQPQVCPFCWCRTYVYDTFERLRFAYYGHEPKEVRIDPYTQEVEKIQPRPFDLMEVLTTVTIDHRVPVPQLFKENIEVGRNGLVRRLHGWGAFQLFTIEPSDPRDKEPVWTFKQRILSVTEPGSQEPPPINENVVPTGLVRRNRIFKRHPGVNHEILIGAVGRMCQYPVQMLQGSQDDAVAILNYINTYQSPGRSVDSAKPSGFRMSGFYGILRNKTQALREKKMGIV